MIARLSVASAWLVLVAVSCVGDSSAPAVRSLEMPDLSGLTDGAREQLTRQHQNTLAASAAEGTLAAEEWGALGQLLFTYGLLDAAEIALLNASALDPRDPSWPYYLGMLHRRRGEFEAAGERFLAVIEAAPEEHLARLRLAEIHLETSRHAEAEALLTELLEEDPVNAFAHFLRGQVALEVGDDQTALVHLEMVLQLQPTATRVHGVLGPVYGRLGQEERARYH